MNNAWSASPGPPHKPVSRWGSAASRMWCALTVRRRTVLRAVREAGERGRVIEKDDGTLFSSFSAPAAFVQALRRAKEHRPMTYPNMVRTLAAALRDGVRVNTFFNLTPHV